MSDEESVLVAAAFSFVSQERMEAAALAWALYDHIITFDEEVRLIWRRKFNGASLLYVLTRYLLLGSLLSGPFSVSSLAFQGYGFPSLGSSVSCLVFSVWRRTLLYASYAVWALFSGLRVYALCRLKSVTAVVIALLLVSVATNIYNSTQTESHILVLPAPFYCSSASPTSIYASQVFLIGTRTANILGDLIVLLVTWYKTYSVRTAAKDAAFKTSLSELLLRDGTAYFAILVTLNVMHMAFVLTNTYISVLEVTDTLTPILIARFILDLRSFDRAGNMSSSGAWTGQSQSVMFAHINIGGLGVDEARVDVGGFSARFVDPLGTPLREFCGAEDAEDHGEFGLVC